MAKSLPRYVVLKATADSTTYVNRKDEDGSVIYVEKSVFNPAVKIEAERAKINSRYIHLRFDHSNRYWQKSPNNDLLVAVSTKPEEDISKASCTLFEATVSGSSVSLTHVPTGMSVRVMSSALGLKMTDCPSPISYRDWSTLVKLPKHVAFKGDNGKYLLAHYRNGLRFFSNDYNDQWSGHEVELMDDGHIRIKSDHSGKYWNTDSSSTILLNPPSGNTGAQDFLFWPVRIDNNTIALRSALNNKFCRRHTWSDREDSPIADMTTMTTETRLKVQELVADRKIYNVRYRMEDARIFNEAPYVAGTTYVDNFSEKEAAGISVALTYTNETSYSISNSMSVTAGVAVTFEGGLPGIATQSIEVSFSATRAMEWSKETKTSTSVTATGTVPVPPKSRATVSYVGTRATCDVPFSYTYQDTSSVDGTITEGESDDGFYTGVNSYNFTFVVQNVASL